MVAASATETESLREKERERERERGEGKRYSTVISAEEGIYTRAEAERKYEVWVG